MFVDGIHRELITDFHFGFQYFKYNTAFLWQKCIEFLTLYSPAIPTVANHAISFVSSWATTGIWARVIYACSRISTNITCRITFINIWQWMKTKLSFRISATRRCTDQQSNVLSHDNCQIKVVFRRGTLILFSRNFMV